MARQEHIKDCYSDIDVDILKGPQLYGPKLREMLKGKYEVIEKKKYPDHIKVNPDRCNGCKDCMYLCPCGCYEMQDGKAVWAYGGLCAECGLCQYVCSQVHAIDWSYPEAGTGIVLKWS
ncbi:MAG: indolepyruvate ferredoxin oxidoreductase subunit alpha [Coriobacteriales bacterium]|jgi:ferredoxin-like protein FixX